MIPHPDFGEGNGLGENIFSLGDQLQISVKEDTLFPVADLCVNLGGLAQLQPEADIAGGEVFVEVGLDPQILHQGGGIEEHGTEDAGEPEEVLILDPGAAAALVDLHAEPVVLFPDVGGQIEIRGGEGILRIAHEMAVEPHIAGLLHTLEGNTDISAHQSRIQVKFPDVGTHGVEVPVDLGRAQLRVAVPGIELVGVVDLVEALGLHVTGDLNEAEVTDVIAFLPEFGGPGGGIFAPAEAPLSVQTLAQGGFLLGGGCVGDVVGMGIQAVYPEDLGIFKPFDIRQHNRVLLICKFCFQYTKAPRIRQPKAIVTDAKEKRKTLVPFPKLPEIIPGL